MLSLVRPAPGPAGFTLWCNFREENKVTINANETFRVFIDLFAFVSSIRGFPNARKDWKNQVNANVGEFCLFVFFFYCALNHLDIFWIHTYAIKCVKSSLVPRPVRAIRVTRGGLEPSAIARGVLGKFSRQAWQVTSHPKSPRTTRNETALRDLIFGVHRYTRNVLSNCKKKSVDRLNFKTNVLDNIPK